METSEAAEIKSLFSLQDELWSALNFVDIAALWDEEAAGVTYVGDEYAAPLVGWTELHRHWARVAARIREASIRSTVLSVDVLSPELAFVVVDCAWQLVGVESATRHQGKSWVTVVLRRRSNGWRFVHYAEAPVYDSDSAASE